MMRELFGEMTLDVTDASETDELDECEPVRIGDIPRPKKSIVQFRGKGRNRQVRLQETLPGDLACTLSRMTFLAEAEVDRSFVETEEQSGALWLGHTTALEEHLKAIQKLEKLPASPAVLERLRWCRRLAQMHRTVLSPPCGPDERS